MTRLDVAAQAHEGRATLALHGELDLGTDTQLRDAATNVLRGDDIRSLDLDLAELTFLDSTGVSALLDLRKQASERGIAVQIVAISRRAARVLTIVGLAESFGLPVDPDAVPGQTATDA
jgi:anti-sigma B factor antagonist